MASAVRLGGVKAASCGELGWEIFLNHIESALYRAMLGYMCLCHNLCAELRPFWILESTARSGDTDINLPGAARFWGPDLQQALALPHGNSPNQRSVAAIARGLNCAQLSVSRVAQWRARSAMSMVVPDIPEEAG